MGDYTYAGREHPSIAGAGHFLQEDQPAACVDAILTLIRDTP